MDADSEFDRWMTLERIATSDFSAILFDGLHDGTWTQEQAATVAVSAISGFGNGNCYFLAAAVAKATGLPIIGFMRDHEVSPLVHAVIHDPRDGMVFDIIGKRTLTDVRAELKAAVGDLKITVLPDISAEMDAVDLEILQFIAGGLPWMPVPQSATDRAAWGRLLVDYVAARSDHRADLPVSAAAS